jgi:hypothetical protein
MPLTLIPGLNSHYFSAQTTELLHEKDLQSASASALAELNTELKPNISAIAKKKKIKKKKGKGKGKLESRPLTNTHLHGSHVMQHCIYCNIN